jgi:hypothetical protein
MRLKLAVRPVTPLAAVIQNGSGPALGTGPRARQATRSLGARR